MKRNLIIVVVLFLAAASGFYYFTKDDVSFSRESSVYKAIPVSTPFFIEFKSMNSIPLNNPVINELKEIGIASLFFQKLDEVDSLIQVDENLPGRLRNEPFIIAFDLTGRNELDPLFIKQINNNSEKATIEQLLAAVFATANNSANERNYSSYTITEIDGAGNGTSVFYSFSEGLFFASTKSILVEQAIRQLSADGITADKYFEEVGKTVTAQSEISLYVQHEQFPVWLGNLVSRNTSSETTEFGDTKTFNYSLAVQEFEDFAAWSELDLDFEDDHFSMGGISAGTDSLNHFLSIFEDQEAVRYNADEVLPRNTSFFCSFSISDKEQFFTRLENYFAHSDFYYEREEMIKSMEAGFRTDLRNTLQEIVDDEMIVATTSVPVDPSDKTSYFILHTESGSEAWERIIELLSTYASREDISIEELTANYSIDDELAYTIYRFPYPSLPGIWLGKPFGLAHAGFMAVTGNYLVFCSSEHGLREYLYSVALGSTLNQDSRYARFKQKIPNRSNINVYADVNRVFSLTHQILSDELVEALEEKEENIRKFWAVNWQVQRSRDIYFNSVFVGFNETVREEAQTTWQSTIGSGVDFKPQIVLNHNDPLYREIVLQDEQNTLYQITSEGRIRWSLPIPGKIMSEIHQIDYYKNGNLQYLFNTKEQLYLIDRNGNNVANFPVTLRSPATNGVNVFDYENARNYRYFIAGEDNKIYAYDSAGNIVTGWEFDKTDNPVTTPVQHFRIERRDYIVFKDESRIYIQDRRGQTRVETAANFKNSQNPLVLNLIGAPKLVASDAEGQVYYIYFDGKYEVKDVGNFSPDHFFTCEDLDGNQVPDFIFADDTDLTVVDENGRKLYSKKLDNPITSPPNIYDFGTTMKKVGIVEAGINRIYLFNPDGNLHDGFPLQGSSEFSIGQLSENSGQLNLIVGSEGGTLFNYTLN